MYYYIYYIYIHTYIHIYIFFTYYILHILFCRFLWLLDYTYIHIHIIYIHIILYTCNVLCIHVLYIYLLIYARICNVCNVIIFKIMVNLIREKNFPYFHKDVWIGKIGKKSNAWKYACCNKVCAWYTTTEIGIRSPLILKIEIFNRGINILPFNSNI